MRVINKVFLHVIDYPGAPELAVLGDGTVQINGKEVADPVEIAKALIDNAKAWAECVDRAHAVDKPMGIESAVIGDTEATLVQTYTGIAIKGPWPATAEGSPIDVMG